MVLKMQVCSMQDLKNYWGPHLMWLPFPDQDSEIQYAMTFIKNLLALKIYSNKVTLACCLLLVMLLPLHGIAATEFKIIDLQYRFVEDILPIIQPLAGNDGAVTGMQNHLIIRASPEKMREIEQVVATLDVIRQNFKITVRRENNLQTTQDGVDINGRNQVGSVKIGTSKYPTDSRDGIRLGIDSRRNSTKNRSNQFINVLDGESAFIRVGQSLPFTQGWRLLTRRYISIQQSIEFIDISTGFVVRPRSIGNQIELEIIPRIAQLNQKGFIDFEELSTVVRAKKGEWLNLGGIMQQKDEVSRTILSIHRYDQSQNNELSIKID